MKKVVDYAFAIRKVIGSNKRQKGTTMNAKIAELKALLESIAVKLELGNSSDAEKVRAYSEIGSIVVDVVPFGSITSVLAGIADRSKDAGSDHVAEALEVAIASIEEAEES